MLNEMFQHQNFKKQLSYVKISIRVQINSTFAKTHKIYFTCKFWTLYYSN